MNPPYDEPSIPRRLQRPLAALWISVALHAALIALVQVVPSTMPVGGPTIEVRLMPGHDATTAPALQSTKPAEADVEPVPSIAETPQAAEPEALPAPAADASPAVTPAGEVQQSMAAPAETPPVAIAVGADLNYYSTRELDVQPRPLREIVPAYPPEADRQRLSGKVRLQLKLEADGRVSEAKVLEAVPPDVFDDSALDAFREARFVPAQRQGRPVRAQLVIELLYDWNGRR